MTCKLGTHSIFFLNERKEMPLTGTFFPQCTGAASSPGGGRLDTAVGLRQCELEALAAQSVQLAHGQGQHSSPPLVPGTHLQGRPERNLVNYIIYKMCIP